MERKYYFRGLGLGIAVTAIIMGAVTSHGRTMTDQEIIARAKELGMVENTVLSDMNVEEADEAAAVNGGGSEEDNSGVVDGKQTADGNTNEEKGLQADGDESREINPAQDGDSKSKEADRDSDDSGEDKNLNGGSDNSSEAQDGQDSPDQSAEEDKAGEVNGTNQPADRDKKADQPGSENDSRKGEGGNITVSSGDGSHTVARKLAEAGIVSSADSFDQFLCQNGYDKKLRTGTFYIPADADDDQIAKIITGVE
ncbi:MAG: hypothetical protein K2P48_01645 [Lachnospiraceae bacterium]|nr:hypothetical protein [Lachnospiraceae bacterium]